MIQKIKKHYQNRKLRKAQQKEYIENMPSYYDHKELSWIAPEYMTHHRGMMWKVVMSLIIVGVIAYGAFYNALTFSLAVVTFAAVHFLLNRKESREVEVVISNVGIKVGRRKYPYSKIKHFWIHYDPPYVRALRIRVDGDIAGEIIIQLNHQSPSEVREFLIDKIPELEGHHETLTELFVRAFKI